MRDNPGDARLIEVMLAKAGSLIFSLDHSTSLSEGLDHLDKSTYDVILLDIGLTDSMGLDISECAAEEDTASVAPILRISAD